ncbi:MAG: M23 family metallopeptidase [Rectinemataceae bacterium]|nr:M23 family metallopeptidase [Rectinemataceae bacterium]
MHINTDKAQGRQDASAQVAFRSKPFLTILDGKPAAKHKSRRNNAAPKEIHSAIQKNSVRLKSYAQEGIQKAFIDGRSRIGTTSKSLAGKVRGIFKARTPKEKTVTPVAEPALAPSPLPDKTLTARIQSLKFTSLHAPRIALIGLIAVIALTAATAAIISATSFPVTQGSLLLPDEESAQAALMAYLEPDSGSVEALPKGALPPIPVSVRIGSYSIKSGDTLEKIAKRFGLRQDTIISANGLQSASSIRPGVQLRIPNMDGISHKVRSGENLSYLAKTYAIDITRIVDTNDLASGTISAGQSLFIPNARLSSASLRNFYGERFVWPARGRISSAFGYRANPFTGLRTYHSAIDIVISPGTKVKATAEGSVADTGYNSVFGNYIILKHASGYQSLYAHLSSIGVKEGSSVAQGGTIGLSGNTGQSTGPHLHFSIFKNGQALDPTKYVK